MATLTVTPLNNGITLDVGEIIHSVLPTYSGSYLYITDLGKLYWQANLAVPVVLLGTTTFAVTCAELFFDGAVHTIWIGGGFGNYCLMTITIDSTDPNLPTQTNTITPAVQNATKHYTAVVFDLVSFGFTVGDSTGSLYTADVVTGALTFVENLPTTTQPASTTLVIKKICHDVNTNNYLICATASTNTNDPAAPEAAGNYSALYVGDIAGVFNRFELTGRNLWLAAIGYIDNPNAQPNEATLQKLPKFVVAGEDSRIFTSSDVGVTWVETLLKDQALTMNSLCFTGWSFVGGLVYGLMMVSTNGVNWSSIYDPQLFNDLTTVTPITL